MYNSFGSDKMIFITNTNEVNQKMEVTSFQWKLPKKLDLRNNNRMERPGTINSLMLNPCVDQNMLKFKFFNYLE